MNSTPSLLVPLPEINRHEHSLFSLSASAAESWLETLPRANVGETTRHLYQALSELSHVRCKGKDRFEILEKIRPHVHYITEGLSQHYLNKSIVLDTKSEKIVQLADTLNTLLALGYCQSFVSLELEPRLIKPKDTLASCLHRALSEYSSVLLRCYQLYRAAPRRFWQNLHHLYRSAQMHKLGRQRVNDHSRGSSTVEQAYIKPLMLSCSRCSQLSPRYIQQVFLALDFWSSKVELRDRRLESCVFLLDPNQDQAPVYRELADKAPGPSWLGLDTGALQGGSARLLHAIPANSKALQHIKLPEQVLNQLSMAWSAATTRAAERIACDDEALIAVGMNPSHFYVANQTDFGDFSSSRSSQAQSSPFEIKPSDNGDPWSQHGGRDTRDYDIDHHWTSDHEQAGLVEDISYSLPDANSANSKSESAYQYVRARLMDSSNSGYRIEWPDTIASRIRTGEVIGVKTDDYDNWRVAVVRWLRSDGSHQMGVEIIASVATAYSARPIQAGLPSGDFQRALLIPPREGDRSPLIMLTNIADFASNQAVELLRPDHSTRIKLDDMVDSSAAYKLFTFHELSPPTTAKPAPSNTDEKRDDDGSQFSNLWDIL